MSDLPRPPRVPLVHGPTPLVKRPALDGMLGLDLWIKRDDATGGAEAGNKVRKLELLLGDALARGSDTVITCGGIQSNHARATALACASLGLACVLLLRVKDPAATVLPRDGNVLLDRLAGAEVRLVSHAEYAQRARCHGGRRERAARPRQAPYVVPEGGSNGLGSLGYVDVHARGARADAARPGGDGRAVRRRRPRVRLGRDGRGRRARRRRSRGRPERPRHGGVRRRGVLRGGHRADRGGGASLGCVARRAGAAGRRRHGKGPAYAVSSPEQLDTIVAVARASGLVLDPVYTGKAMHGLSRRCAAATSAGRPRALPAHGGLARAARAGRRVRGAARMTAAAPDPDPTAAPTVAEARRVVGWGLVFWGAAQIAGGRLLEQRDGGGGRAGRPGRVGGRPHRHHLERPPRGDPVRQGHRAPRRDWRRDGPAAAAGWWSSRWSRRTP